MVSLKSILGDKNAEAIIHSLEFIEYAEPTFSPEELGNLVELAQRSVSLDSDSYNRRRNVEIKAARVMLRNLFAEFQASR